MGFAACDGLLPSPKSQVHDTPPALRLEKAIVFGVLCWTARVVASLGFGVAAPPW